MPKIEDLYSEIRDLKCELCNARQRETDALRDHEHEIETLRAKHYADRSSLNGKIVTLERTVENLELNTMQTGALLMAR